MTYLSQTCETSQAVPYSAETLLSHAGDPRAAPQHDGAGGNKAADCRFQILLIGDDPTLQYSRQKVLESAGYTVKPATSNLVVEELSFHGIELVLLCHTIPGDVAMRIVTAFARLAPQIPLLRISALDNSYADGGNVTWVPPRPVALLLAVAEMLQHIERDVPIHNGK